MLSIKIRLNVGNRDSAYPAIYRLPDQREADNTKYILLLSFFFDFIFRKYYQETSRLTF